MIEIEVCQQLDSQIHRVLEPLEEWKRYCLCDRKEGMRRKGEYTLDSVPLLHTLCSGRTMDNYRSWSLDDWNDVKPQVNGDGT